jgi:hypothetical protein
MSKDVFENSPAIYGWVLRQKTNQVPQGRKECPAVPDGTWKINRAFFPAINGRAIFDGRIILKRSCTPLTPA